MSTPVNSSDLRYFDWTLCFPSINPILQLRLVVIDVLLTVLVELHPTAILTFHFVAI